MALNFLKNIFGGENDTVVADTTANSARRNENLSGRTFKKEWQETPGAVLLDVRTAGEFASGTIPGALNIDFLSPTFGKKVSELDKNVTYFLFCRSGNRSGQACRLMYQQGFDVRNLSGGIGEFPF